MQYNRVTELFNIKYSIIQGGMVWVSGYKLASAVSNAGGLGLIGAGSMYPDVFREHIKKCKKATDKPFGVNLPLIYPEIDKMVDIVVEEGVKIVFTSAGNPNTWTSKLKSHGIKVVHVVSSIKFAMKAQEAGVDAVVTEGFEAGGHNGREETTTFTLIPMVKEYLSVPLIAAGGIASGRGILAAEVLGADGVQIGSRFAVSTESSAHIKFKNLITELQDGTTQLTFKELAPVRIIKNNYYQKLLALYQTNPSKETLKTFYDNAKLKTGIFEGEVEDGKLEIGQIAGLIKDVQPIANIMNEMITEYNAVKQNLK
ncbi:NAD(P)H-dependent flavin oxidoreductase [Wenyingzhuangia marina]|uniref:Enoyl-[acyl-carrier protein] reductase II n=1 Tax=Wenyingzhuangia marina TaxID=1195760 RepID=A0A1M5W7J4_9FLAO|nr:nitronate monooxygenase [Wenyingzhuangia marina]GGF75459.1 2-nitropropane dioxygenase [Wenyingzhuangia marina]SHH83154.1 enoyl-[acyl-carrier protein] reductase II [Wenyingzhuangia marina]